MTQKRVVLLKSRLEHLGGLEKYTWRLAEAFIKSGHLVTLLTTGPVQKRSDFEIISVTQGSKNSLHNLFLFDKACRRLCTTQTYDIIFGMERTSYQTHLRAGSGVHAVYLKRRALTDSFFKQCSFFINPQHRYILHKEKVAFESPDLRILFTNSFMVQNEILARYKTPENKISVVHNGVEWHQWETYFQQSFLEPRKDPFHFLFVGHGFRRKGLLFLLQGLALLKNKEFVLTIVGKDKEQAFFEKMTEKLHLKKFVHFAGLQKNVFQYYQKADALVIPSIYDPFANVTVEALAMGLFVVSSRFNGGHEVLTPETGEIIEELSSPESVAKSLEKAFSRPKTKESASYIRSGIKGLDFSHQLDKIVRQTCTI